MDNEKLVSENLKLVHSCCKHFRSRGVEYDDLYGAGCLGLVKAAKAFDKSLGYRFSTYAVPVILGEIKRLFRDGGAVKVSRSLKELSCRAVKKQSELCNTLQREPTVSELAEALGVSCEDAAEAVCAAAAPTSLSYIGKDGEEKELEIGTECSAEDAVSNRLALNQVISRLGEQDRKLIILRYFQNKTQTETARQIGMTQVQVSRREKKLLGIMKSYF